MVVEFGSFQELVVGNLLGALPNAVIGPPDDAVHKLWELTL
jgi:hypothetical protein